MPGSAPFHLNVAFRAFRGIGCGKRDQCTILTGDGTYQESWISPEKWRREVDFGSYRAVELRNSGTRKFHSNSDYEPSRVLMLLDALLSPIPRNLLTSELNEQPVDWRLRTLESDAIPYVLVSGTGAAHIYVYAFLLNGMLFRSGRAGLLMSWSKPLQFGGKLVPSRIVVAALGADLLTANVSIEPLRTIDPASLDLPVPPADAGMTLRPLHWFDVKSARLDSHRYHLPGDSLVHGIVHAVIDRYGQLRDVEAVDGPDDKSIIQSLITMTDRDRWHPPTIDSSPCEEMVDYIW